MQAVYELTRENDDRLYLHCGANICWPHFHSHIECLFLQEHALDVTINDQTFTMLPGQFLIADSFDIHAYQSQDSLSLSTVLLIPARYLSDYKRFKDGKQLSRPVVTDAGAAAELYQLILRIYENDRRNELVKQGCVNELLGAVLDHIPLSREKKKSNLPIRDILLYLEQNYRENIRLEQIASHFGYSMYHFSRIFHQYFRCSLSEYVNRLRVSEVIRVHKLNPDEKLFTVILESGFSSIQTFYRCFRQFYGRAPLEYLSEIEKDRASVSV